MTFSYLLSINVRTNVVASFQERRWAMEVLVTGVVLLIVLAGFVRAVRVKKVVIEFDRNEKPPKQLNH